MKKLVVVFSFFLFAFILSSSLFLVGCKSDTINGPDIINPPPDTLGNVSGYINSSDGPVEDAYIVLNNKTTFSDSNGFFQFKDCIKKDLVITITHPEFSEFSNSINVSDSLDLDITLTRIKYDYFPLKVGNQWQYHWTYGWGASGGYGGQSSGTLDLKVISVAGTYPNYTFQVRETRYDSTSNYTTQMNINIQKNNSDSIRVSEYTYFFKTTNIRRFYYITFGDTVYNFGSYDNYTLKLKKNIGAIQCYYGMAGITFGYSTEYKILSYTLN